MSLTKSVAITKTFSPGQYLFHEGDPSQAIYLIQKGTVAIRKHKGSAYIELARLYSKEVLGELSFFDRMPRSAAAVALTDVEVLEIKFENLDKIYANVPDYLKTIMASVADRLRKANETIRRLQRDVVKDGGAPSTVEESILKSTEIPSDIPATSPPDAEPIPGDEKK